MPKDKPEIRFAGYTDAWEKRKLLDVSNHRGGTAIEKYFEKNGQYKVISIGSYGLNSEYVDQDIRAISNTITDSHLVNSGELTMILNDKTANGTIIGRTLLIQQDNEYVVNQRTEIIAPKKSFDPNFAYVLLNGPFREKIKRIVQGGTQIYVNYSAVENLSLKLPNIEEQKIIGLLFKQLDHLITVNQRKVDLLKELKKGFLQKMFPKNGEDKPEIRFGGYTDAWEKRKLVDIAGSISDGDWIEANHIFDKGEFRIIQTGNIGVNAYLDKTNSAKYFHQRDFDDLHANEIFTGDILISRLSEPAGRTMILPDINNRAVTSVDVAIIRPNNDFDSNFLVAQLNSSTILAKVDSLSSGSTRKRISRKNLEQVQLHLATIEEQQKIGKFIFLCNNLITVNQRRVDLLKQEKKALLQKMFV